VTQPDAREGQAGPPGESDGFWSRVQVAIAWVLAQPGITSAIVGAGRPAQLEESHKAVDETLDAAEMEACNLEWYKLLRPVKPVR